MRSDPNFACDEGYTYDSNGNRTNTGYSTGTDNRLLSDGTYRYAYDGEGNRTFRYIDVDQSGTLSTNDTNITKYDWDNRNRLTGVSHYAGYSDYTQGHYDNTSVWYTYDAYDRRIRRMTDSNGYLAGGVDYFYNVYQGDNVALEINDIDGLAATANSPHVEHRYLYGQAVDEILASDDGTNVLWGLGDHEGTIRDIVNNSGVVQSHRAFDSYGKLTSGTINNSFPFGYTGFWTDTTTGMVGTTSRWYDPNVGRWLSEDPSGLSIDANLFRYVRNDPLNNTDPTGLCGKAASNSFSYDSLLFNPSNLANTNSYFGTSNVVDTNYYPSSTWMTNADSQRLSATSAPGPAMATFMPRDVSNSTLRSDPILASEVLQRQRDIGFVSDIASTIGLAQGVGQGVLNSINGLQNIGIGLANLANESAYENIVPAPIRIAADLNDYRIPQISSPDWARGKASYETDWGHSISTFCGGNAAFTAATFGAGELGLLGKAGSIRPICASMNDEIVMAEVAPVQYPEGSFSISNWSGYPEGLPRPEGPFRLVEGAEYDAARNTANATNRTIHRTDASLAGQRIHEIQPVKFGGSPTDPTNKIPLPPQQHSTITNWWNRLLRSIRGD